MSRQWAMSTAYRVDVERDGKFWHIRVPAVNRSTQARTLAGAQAAARDLIAIMTGVPADSFDIDVHLERGPVRGGGTVSAAITVHADGSFSPIRHEAGLTCPACAHAFTGRWRQGHDTADQECPSCGHVFAGTWPGFRLEPETVILQPGSEAGDAT